VTQSWAEAELHYEAALAANAGMGARPWCARTENDYARMLHAGNDRGDRERAQALLDAAARTHRELGMDSYAASAAASAPDAGSST
jgi:hypothetical protein